MSTFNPSIQTPCSEKWRNFVPTEKGGFCKICFKEVVDFNKMNDEEIKTYFNSVTKSTCGRFKNDQFKTCTSKGRPELLPALASLKIAFTSFINLLAHTISFSKLKQLM